MKLGILMLVLGLIIAGVGIAAWIYADSGTSYFIDITRSPGGWMVEGQAADAVGIGGAVLGGGLAIGGIVRMIVKR